MKVLVLGGCGIQGRTALHDLASDDQVTEVICADAQFDALSKINPFTPMEKIILTTIDAKNADDLVNVMKPVDVVIDLLPKEFAEPVNQAALTAKVSVVNTNYMYDPGDMHDKAAAAGIAILPECGLDPGIDLVLYGSALRRFDTLTGIKSYCGGFPEKSACTNPLNYKTSWIWRGVLSSTKRDSTFIVDGKRINIPGARQHDAANIHSVEFPGLGTLEAIPNGNAAFFTDRMGIADTIVNTGRYSLRWPGWAAIWRPMKDLGFLDETPVPGLGDGTISPMDFMDKFLAPRLVYQDNEKDLVAMLNIFEGFMAGKKMRLTSTLLFERDLDTGLMAMSKGVAYSAVTAAKMIANKQITDTGVLSPMFHIPEAPFLESLKKRGITVTETLEKIQN
ncbi:saccharopine dehydrogenase family protein [Desulfotignum balticum]|uniref:saccharopine dehydrogenase family protein n=1 Tax=Desulfotignum balticum TaxID=115781 RepID=UPI0004176C51|nr:saccharopine dehydrogenase C-terminal domain-containing protein [Desulfotignum balticum]